MSSGGLLGGVRTRRNQTRPKIPNMNKTTGGGEKFQNGEKRKKGREWQSDYQRQKTKAK